MAATPYLREEINPDAQDLTKPPLVVPDVCLGPTHPVVATPLNQLALLMERNRRVNHLLSKLDVSVVASPM